MSLEDLAHSQKAAEADPGARPQAQLGVQRAVPQNERSTPTCYGSQVSLPKFLVFLAKLPEVNLAEKPNRNFESGCHELQCCQAFKVCILL